MSDEIKFIVDPTPRVPIKPPVRTFNEGIDRDPDDFDLTPTGIIAYKVSDSLVELRQMVLDLPEGGDQDNSTLLKSYPTSSPCRSLYISHDRYLYIAYPAEVEKYDFEGALISSIEFSPHVLSGDRDNGIVGDRFGNIYVIAHSGTNPALVHIYKIDKGLSEIIFTSEVIRPRNNSSFFLNKVFCDFYGNVFCLASTINETVLYRVSAIDGKVLGLARSGSDPFLLHAVQVENNRIYAAEITQKTSTGYAFTVYVFDYSFNLIDIRGPYSPIGHTITFSSARKTLIVANGVLCVGHFDNYVHFFDWNTKEYLRSDLNNEGLGTGTGSRTLFLDADYAGNVYISSGAGNDSRRHRVVNPVTGQRLSRYSRSPTGSAAEVIAVHKSYRSGLMNAGSLFIDNSIGMNCAFRSAVTSTMSISIRFPGMYAKGSKYVLAIHTTTEIFHTFEIDRGNWVKINAFSNNATESSERRYVHVYMCDDSPELPNTLAAITHNHLSGINISCALYKVSTQNNNPVVLREYKSITTEDTTNNIYDDFYPEIDVKSNEVLLFINGCNNTGSSSYSERGFKAYLLEVFSESFILEGMDNFMKKFDAGETLRQRFRHIKALGGTRHSHINIVMRFGKLYD